MRDNSRGENREAARDSLIDSCADIGQILCPIYSAKRTFVERRYVRDGRYNDKFRAMPLHWLSVFGGFEMYL